MRGVLGAGVLLAGVAGLSVWGATHQARTMEATIADRAARITEGAVHDIALTVSGRDIRVSGYADSPQEKGFLLAALDQIDGRRVVVDDLQVLAAISPYRLNGAKGTQGDSAQRVGVTGHVPSEDARAVLGGADGVEDLLLASGEPDGWLSAAAAAIAALGPLSSGTFDLVDQSLTLTGEAETGAEKDIALAALSDLPQGYVSEVTITVRLTEEEITAAIDRAVRDLVADLPQADLSRSGRDIRLAGLASDQAQIERIAAQLADVPRIGAVTNDLAVMPTMTPYRLSVTKAGTGALTLDGAVPDRALMDRLGARGDVSGLGFANGAPDGLDRAMTAVLAGLDDLRDGQATLTGKALTLGGTAPDAAAQDRVLAALSALPPGYSADVDIALADDGRPPDFTLTWRADGGASVAGKLPAGFGQADMARALGLPTVLGTPDQAVQDDGRTATAAAQALSAFAPWLGQLETASLRFEDGRVTALSGVMSPGAILAQVDANLAVAFPRATRALRRAVPDDLPPDGTVRFNAALVQDERFSGGYWLPLIEDFEVSEQGCRDRSAAIMASVQITFLTGEAELSAASLADLNRIASVVRRCVAEAGLRARLGGHTDDVGDETANLDLSQARAEVVRAAMIARGIPPAAISAQGYGETRPIADNATEAGRAQNRRTTIDWSVAD